MVHASRSCAGRLGPVRDRSLCNAAQSIAMREQQPLLHDNNSSSSNASRSPAIAAVASIALPMRDATVSAARSLPSELSSFPCLDINTTTMLYTFFERIWNGAQSRSPVWLRPVFVHCEETELIGAGCIAALVGCFVAAGFLIVFPALTPGWARTLLKLAFIVQVIVGYACLFLFRNVNPGYIPVNEGAIGEWRCGAAQGGMQRSISWHARGSNTTDLLTLSRTVVWTCFFQTRRPPRFCLA